MARRDGVSPELFVRQSGLAAKRLEQLLVRMESVFQVSTFLLWLRQRRYSWEWSPLQWDVEVEKLFQARGRAFNLRFHGAATMVSRDGRWCPIVVEWDLRRNPVTGDRDRLVKLVRAQEDPRFWGSDKEDLFPTLVLVAQDELRLQDYYALLRAAALSRHLPMPRAYLATFADVLALRNHPAAPIWYSTTSGRRTALLYDNQGTTTPKPEKAPWRRLILQHRKTRRNDGAVTANTSRAAPYERKTVTPLGDGRNAAHIAKNLGPSDKLILDEIADHPLLAADEIAVLLHHSGWRVRRALAKLVEMNLVEKHSIPRVIQEESAQSHCLGPGMPHVPADQFEDRYVLIESGMNYLAIVAGYRNAIRGYARARGWLAGFDTLVRFGEHTREENSFFLDLARVACRRNHRLYWLSELESRLYYDAGHNFMARTSRPRPRNSFQPGPAVHRIRPRQIWRHSFLPDGRGTYITPEVAFDFALEIDRSRNAMGKIRRKLVEYYACITSNILRAEGIELLRLLIVTRSWRRTESLRRTALELESELETGALLPTFITTFHELRTRGANAPIWLRVAPDRPNESTLQRSKSYCFDCFTAPERSERKRKAC